MDKTKTCWYCGKDTMQPAPEWGSSFYKCSACGASYVIPLKLGINPLGVGTDVDNGQPTRVRRPRRRPSGRLIKEAAKARATKRKE